jgi:serine/threonine-protein kinase
MDILLAHATDTPPSFADLGLSGWVPDEVEELVFGVLAKYPDDRPQTARELAERFDTALNRAQMNAEAPFAGAAAPRSQAGAPGAAVATPPPAAAGTLARATAALPFHMEAWMPERLAIMKLRGFVHDAGGEVVESVPGLIKVRLGGRKGSGAGGPLSWLGLRRSSNPIDVELHLHHLNPAKDNQLTVHVLFRPSHPALLTDRNWRQRCTQVFIELRAYLMGRSPE